MDDLADFEAAVDQRKRIDKQLADPTRLSLPQWRDTCTRLKEPGTREERDRFVLTGHYTDPITQQPTRSRIDFHDHRIPEHIVPKQLSDIDSVVGIVRDRFPIVPGVVLKYFMMLSPSHTLDSNLHLPPTRVEDGQGPDKLVHLHQILNGRFMEMEPQGLIRIFFPRAERGASKSNCLTNHKLELLYDYAVRPAADAELPRELTGCWPATWSDEQYRAENIREREKQSANGDHGRQVQHSGRDVHSIYLNAFVDHMRRCVNTVAKLAWARSFFFVVEMRGLKTREGSMHLPPVQAVANDDGELDEKSPRVQAVEEILSSFHTEEFEQDHWHIDLGLNFTVPSPLGGFNCPLPSVEAHAAILAHVLGIDMPTCLGWVQGRGGHYERDELAQLKALGGFRMTNPKPDVNGISYIQLYTSDKATIYNLNLTQHAKRITPWQALDDWDKVRKHHFQPLLEVFKNASAAHEMYLRLEVRVEFTQYPYVQLRVPDEKARAWMFSADPKDYWGWKLFRLESIYSVLRMWMENRRSSMLGDLPESGSMFVTLVWMANALVNRPDEGGTWNEIRDASSVHSMFEGRLVPVWPLQAHFLHSLRLAPDEQPRLSSQRVTSTKTILYVCSSKKPMLTESQLHALIADSANANIDFEPERLDEEPSRAHLAHPEAVSNKQRIVDVRSRERQEDLFAEVLPEPKRAKRYDSEDEDFEERAQPTPQSLVLTNLLTDLPVQMFRKSPNQKDNRRSWSAIENSSPIVTFGLFNSMENLAIAYPCHVLWGNRTDRWDSTVNALLPSIADAQEKKQGLHCLEARTAFVELQRRQPNAEARQRVLDEARRYVHTHWVWLPYGVHKGRLWATGASHQAAGCINVGPLVGGPWIILNPALSD